MDKHEYFGLCASHDWFFNYTEDPSVYRRGSSESQILMKYYREDDQYKDIYSAWSDCIHNDAPTPDFKDFE